MRTRQILMSLAVTAAVLTGTACGGGASSPSTTLRAATSALGTDVKATYEYVVPYGTSVRINQGQVVDIMPQTLNVKVGESISIWNQDGEPYMIGPFYVNASQKVAMRFTQKGTLSGVCSMNPEGEFIINVSA
jgi:hypothetical protein